MSAYSKAEINQEKEQIMIVFGATSSMSKPHDYFFLLMLCLVVLLCVQLSILFRNLEVYEL